MPLKLLRKKERKKEGIEEGEERGENYIAKDQKLKNKLKGQSLNSVSDFTL